MSSGIEIIVGFFHFASRVSIINANNEKIKSDERLIILWNLIRRIDEIYVGLWFWNYFEKSFELL